MHFNLISIDTSVVEIKVVKETATAVEDDDQVAVSGYPSFFEMLRFSLHTEFSNGDRHRSMFLLCKGNYFIFSNVLQDCFYCASLYKHMKQ